MLENQIKLANKIENLKSEYKKNSKDLFVFSIILFILVLISVSLLLTGYFLSNDEKTHVVMWISLIFIIPTSCIGVIGSVYIYLKIYPTIIIYRVVVERKPQWKEIARRWYKREKIKKWLDEYNFVPDDETIVE